MSAEERPRLLGAAVDRVLADTLRDVAARITEGRVADYIPELADADPGAFGVSIASVLGRAYGAGDADAPFTIQSASKPFVYAFACEELGAATVHERVGVEPSGEPFNAISLDERGRPENPFINAGAIVTTSLVPADDADERYRRIRDVLSRFAGRELDLDDEVYRSEAKTGHRNRALAGLALAAGSLATGDVDAATDPYFRQCALRVTTADLAIMGATLANGGMNPITRDRVVGERAARDTLSVMATCGMYDRSGAWAFRVGMPAKSGVGGGIVAVRPGEFGVGVYAPPLDEAGNSARGVAMLEALSDRFGLHMFDHVAEPVSPVAEVDVDAEAGTVTFDLRGELDFVAAEQIVHDVGRVLQHTDARVVRLDFGDVTVVAGVAEQLLGETAAAAEAAGVEVHAVGAPDRVLELFGLAERD
ncbi:glutaminase A [Agromyces kandeliae]|uniref:glutaminase A n=1 Tax=Agromyces kandeliae TaxID=2666141 RepID=UPI002D2190F0|nr:glutaminase A [Agromyces kandeliae]